MDYGIARPNINDPQKDTKDKKEMDEDTNINSINIYISEDIRAEMEKYGGEPDNKTI